MRHEPMRHGSTNGRRGVLVGVSAAVLATLIGVGVLVVAALVRSIFR